MNIYELLRLDAALLDLLEGSIFFANPSLFHKGNDKLEGEFVMETNASTFSKAIVDALNEIIE